MGTVKGLVRTRFDLTPKPVLKPSPPVDPRGGVGGDPAAPVFATGDPGAVLAASAPRRQVAPPVGRPVVRPMPLQESEVGPNGEPLPKIPSATNLLDLRAAMDRGIAAARLKRGPKVTLGVGPESGLDFLRRRKFGPRLPNGYKDVIAATAGGELRPGAWGVPNNAGSVMPQTLLSSQIIATKEGIDASIAAVQNQIQDLASRVAAPAPASPDALAGGEEKRAAPFDWTQLMYAGAAIFVVILLTRK